MTTSRVKSATLVGAGLYYAVVGSLLWIVPGFFYSHVGHIGVYNVHYERDLASFVLPLGIGIILGSQDPSKHRLLLAVATVGSLLHAFSHLAEGVHSSEDALVLLFFVVVAGALGASLWHSREAIQ